MASDIYITHTAGVRTRSRSQSLAVHRIRSLASAQIMSVTIRIVVACNCVQLPAKHMRVSDLLCMSNSVHASKPKEHEDNDDYEGSFRRAAERR